MPYLVRTPDGSLRYASLYDVQRAFEHGLVAPEDELIDEGSGKVLPVRDHPALRAVVEARARGPRGARRGRLLLLLVLFVLTVGAWLAGLYWLAVPAACGLVLAYVAMQLQLRRTGGR